MPQLVTKARNLLDILSLPGGLRLKFTEKAFLLSEFRVCQCLRAAGVEPAGIYDIGANIGQFALAATKTWPRARIKSYEPVEAPLQKLRILARRHPNISPVGKALGASVEQAEIHVTNATQSSSLLPLHRNHLDAYPAVYEETTQLVDVATLEREVRESPMSSPLLLKLDVQGFEYRVLEGAGGAITQFQWIFLETSTRPMYQGERVFEEILSMLKAMNFRFAGPVHVHISPDGIPAQFDALFENARPVG